MVRARDASRMTPAAGAFLNQHQFGVQIIGERNDEKKQHHRAHKRGPLVPGRVAADAALLGPSSAPEKQSGDGNEAPENIEK